MSKKTALLHVLCPLHKVSQMIDQQRESLQKNISDFIIYAPFFFNRQVIHVTPMQESMERTFYIFYVLYSLKK